MKVESWSKTASWVLAFAIILLVAYQHKELQLSRANERSSDVAIGRLVLENSALRLAAKRNEALNELLIPQLLWGGK